MAESIDDILINNELLGNLESEIEEFIERKRNGTLNEKEYETTEFVSLGKKGGKATDERHTYYIIKTQDKEGNSVEIALDLSKTDNEHLYVLWIKYKKAMEEEVPIVYRPVKNEDSAERRLKPKTPEEGLEALYGHMKMVMSKRILYMNLFVKKNQKLKNPYEFKKRWHYCLNTLWAWDIKRENAPFIELDCQIDKFWRYRPTAIFRYRKINSVQQEGENVKEVDYSNILVKFQLNGSKSAVLVYVVDMIDRAMRCDIQD